MESKSPKIMNEIFIYKHELDDFSKSDKDSDILLIDLILKKKIEIGEIIHSCPNHTFSRVKNRMSYQCDKCGYQVYPLKGTILEKTGTSLYAWLLFFNELFEDRNKGISEIRNWLYCGDGKSDEYSITYKTALRMYHLIRNNMFGDKLLLNKLIENYIDNFLPYSTGNLTSVQWQELYSKYIQATPTEQLKNQLK